MTDLQWHTAAPAPPQKQQENLIPQGNTILGLNPKYQDNLVSLIRLLHTNGNPQSTARGQDSDLTLLMDYKNTYGNGPQTRSFAAHPERHAYKMMAALATGDDVRAWLAEWRHRGLDLGPFDKVDFFAPDALVVHQPDGMTRHLHATAAGGNRGRPRILANGLVDPYWGTGLDPAHVSGFVAPYRSALAPYMACCGQELGKNGEIPPGCWIPLETGQPSGRLVPYQVWFQGLSNDSRTIWERVVDGTASREFVDAIQVGTAFLDRAYYRELDRQIRALVATVVPAIVAAQEVVLNAKFPAGASVAQQLAPGIREQIHELVSLVDQYNAPQIGQCFFPTLVDDTFIDERVAFIGQGRKLDAEGVLIIEKEIRSGFFLPRIRAFGQLKKVYESLQTGPEDDEDLVAVGQVINIFLGDMEILKKIIPILEEISKLVGEIQKAVQPTDVFSNVLEKPRIDEITNRFKDEADTVLPGFVDVYNQWWDHPLEVAPIQQFYDLYTARDKKTITDAAAVFQKTGVDVEIMTDYLPQVVEMLTNVRDAYLQKRPVEENDFLKKIYPQSLPLEQIPKAFEQYAHFAAARPAMANAMPVLAKNLESMEQQLLERAKTAIQELARRRIAEEEERSRQDAELARRLQEQEDRVAGGERIIRLEVSSQDVRRDPRPISLDTWNIQRGFAFQNESCTYDSLFAAMFAVPNQWLRNKILQAKAIYHRSACIQQHAKSIDATVVNAIYYFENTRANLRPESAIAGSTCLRPQIWNQCFVLGTEKQIESNEGNPFKLLGELTTFYGISDGYEAFAQPYNNAAWNPRNFQVTPQIQMYAVHAISETFALNTPYQVPITMASEEFTILSCLLFTKFHWHACVRHPGTGIWYRMIDAGEALALKGAVPDEITRQTTSDPARKQNEGEWGDKPSAIYEPMIWFYVRTTALAGFVSKSGSSAVQYFAYNADKTFRVSSDTDVVRLFGRRRDLRNGGPLLVFNVDTMNTSDDEMTLGALQILYMTNVDVDRLKNMRSGVKYAFGDWSWPATINGVNKVIHPQLQKLVSTKTIDGILISPEVWNGFERWAIRTKLMVEVDNQFVVPTWSSTPGFESDPSVLTAPVEWRTARRTDEYFFGSSVEEVCIARLWSYTLSYLLFRLRNKSVDELERLINLEITQVARRIPGL